MQNICKVKGQRVQGSRGGGGRESKSSLLLACTLTLLHTPRPSSNSQPKPVQGKVREIYIRENRSGPLAKGDSRTNPFERIVPGTRNQIAQRSCKVRATTLRSGWKPGQWAAAGGNQGMCVGQRREPKMSSAQAERSEGERTKNKTTCGLEWASWRGTGTMTITQCYLILYCWIYFFLMNKSDVQSWRDYKEIKLLSRNTKLWERDVEAR